MENSMMQNLFGPLSKQYCLYFYVLSVIFLVLGSVLVFSTLVIGITKRKDMSFYFFGLIGALGYGMVYFQNRLLHTMCVGSI
jgi:nicotinamide riboside transporter PnuC